MHGNLLESWCTPKLRLGSIDSFIHIKGQSSSLFIIFAGYEDDVIMISQLHLIQNLDHMLSQEGEDYDCHEGYE